MWRGTECGEGLIMFLGCHNTEDKVLSDILTPALSVDQLPTRIQNGLTYSSMLISSEW